MTNSNGHGARRTEPDITIEHIELRAVFLACLVSLLQVTKECELSSLEALTIPYACSVIDKTIDALKGELDDEWKAGVVRCVRESGEVRVVKEG